MDNVTHTLFALTLSRTRLGRVGTGATATLVLASNAPDVDIVTAFRGGANYIHWHRGPTHGLLGVVGLGLLTAALVWYAERWMRGRDPEALGFRLWSFGTPRAQSREPGASYRSLAGLAMLGVLLHILMDLPTSYGTRLLSPFDWHWFSSDWMPIIDIYLLIVLAAGLVFGQITPEMRRHNVAIALILMAGNYALRGVTHERALALVPRVFGPTLPQWCDGAPQSQRVLVQWPREESVTANGSRRCLVELAAVPTFLSPFKWRIIAHLSNAYEVQEIDVLDRRFLPGATPSEPEVLWRTALRMPNQWTPAVTESTKAPTASIFLGFSRFPVARTFVDPQGVTTVRWSDVRFAGGLGALNQRAQQNGPMSVTVQVGPDNQILLDQMVP